MILHVLFTVIISFNNNVFAIIYCFQLFNKNLIIKHSWPVDFSFNITHKYQYYYIINCFQQSLERRYVSFERWESHPFIRENSDKQRLANSLKSECASIKRRWSSANRHRGSNYTPSFTVTRRRWSMRVGCFMLNDNVKRIITRARVRRVWGRGTPSPPRVYLFHRDLLRRADPRLVFDDPRTAERLWLLECSSDCTPFFFLSLSFFFFFETDS